MNPRHFFAELQRRNVYKVAVAYAVVGWLVIQVATQVFPFFEIPNWAVRLVVLVTIIGFPIALVIAWAFEATPHGIQRTEVADAARQHSRSRAWIYVVIIGAALSIGLFFLGRYTAGSKPSVSADVGIKSIAVLPFVDLSQAKDQEYFCDGISEEILDALAKTPGLRVVARTSSFSFKGKSADVAEIGQKLNVHNVLEGSLRREGNRIRITAQLVNAQDGYHLWSDTFEREMQGVFAVQDEITHSIVEALKLKLAVAPPAHPQPNTEAYDLYLQGLYFSNKSGEAELRKALGLFQSALDKDPTLARAWTGIAKAWYWLADAYLKPVDAYPAVQSAAAKALELNQRDADAHCYFGFAKRVLNWDWNAAEREFERALEIDPNSSTAHLLLAHHRSCTGDLQEASRDIGEAERLDPLSPIISNLQASLYLNFDRLDDALAAAKQTLTIDRNYIYFEPMLARVYREQGKLDDALAIYLEAQEVTHEPTAGLAITYARLGRLSEARAVLTLIIHKASTSYVAAEEIAMVFVALGEHDEAFRWLNRAAHEHTANIIATRRELRPLHSDSRFPELLRRMNIDPAKALAREPQ